MRPESNIQAEQDRYEHTSHEGHEQVLSPSPSLSGSYEYDDDEDQEEQEREVEGIPLSVEQPVAGPSTAPSILPPPPQKPKRTRQLTTPHQAAVLHALLAQSRFPTTAMRENVGKQIGLSARKVQVWFQNQRQKARKGAKEAQTSATTVATAPSASGSGPSHYGAQLNLPHSQHILPSSGFNEGPEGLSSARGGVEPTLTHSIISHASTFPPLAERHEQPSPSVRRPTRSSIESFTTIGLSPPRVTPSDIRLIGPGVPGAAVAPGSDTFSSSLPTHSHASMTHPPLSPEHRIRLPPVHEVTPSRGRPGTTSFEPERFHEGRHAVRLPPLQFISGPQQTREMTTEGGISPQTSFDPPYRAQLSSSMDIPSRVSASAVSPSSLSPPLIPPPFTLEPSPVWQPTRTAAVPPIRPLSSAGSSGIPSGTGTRPQPSQTSGTFRRHSEGGEVPLVEGRILPTPRSTRFDPVRNTLAESSTFSPESRRNFPHSSDDDL